MPPETCQWVRRLYTLVSIALARRLAEHSVSRISDKPLISRNLTALADQTTHKSVQTCRRCILLLHTMGLLFGVVQVQSSDYHTNHAC